MKTDLNQEIITTADGSTTLRSTVFGELYHSDRGALGEAHHVFIRFLHSGDRVLEVGLGSGLNALLSLQSGLRLDYTAVELYPVGNDTVERLSFCDNDLRSIHHAPWGVRCRVTDDFSLLKIEDDLLNVDFEPLAFDTIFFDAFAPDVVPEMWSLEAFKKLYLATAAGGQLLTYSAKGSVKDALRQAGYTVERLQGALGKRHMVRAVKL